eukprot:TRINITY_DN24061_c0_g1_i2.p2 TRINITY_DN24061_c0_g1~~TRINITY_DN24061_c0_g1_i2.p2  ORF type:complete len:443 (-),score=108.89 TRINITY_DN24061_c0_g1_i2:2011-3339(-)
MTGGAQEEPASTSAAESQGAGRRQLHEVTANGRQQRSSSRSPRRTQGGDGAQQSQHIPPPPGLHDHDATLISGEPVDLPVKSEPMDTDGEYDEGLQNVINTEFVKIDPRSRKEIQKLGNRLLNKINRLQKANRKYEALDKDSQIFDDEDLPKSAAPFRQAYTSPFLEDPFDKEADFTFTFTVKKGWSILRAKKEAYRHFMHMQNTFDKLVASKQRSQLKAECTKGAFVAECSAIATKHNTVINSLGLDLGDDDNPRLSNDVIQKKAIVVFRSIVQKAARMKEAEDTKKEQAMKLHNDMIDSLIKKPPRSRFEEAVAQVVDERLASSRTSTTMKRGKGKSSASHDAIAMYTNVGSAGGNKDQVAAIIEKPKNVLSPAQAGAKSRGKKEDTKQPGKGKDKKGKNPKGKGKGKPEGKPGKPKGKAGGKTGKSGKKGKGSTGKGKW